MPWAPFRSSPRFSGAAWAHSSSKPVCETCARGERRDVSSSAITATISASDSRSCPSWLRPLSTDRLRPLTSDGSGGLPSRLLRRPLLKVEPVRSPHGDGDAGGGARDAVDDADGVGDEAADGVESLALDYRDEVVGAGNGVHGQDAGARALDLGERLLHLLGLAGRRFDQHVGFHVSPPWVRILESR